MPQVPQNELPAILNDARGALSKLYRAVTQDDHPGAGLAVGQSDSLEPPFSFNVAPPKIRDALATICKETGVKHEFTSSNGEEGAVFTITDPNMTLEKWFLFIETVNAIKLNNLDIAASLPDDHQGIQSILDATRKAIGNTRGGLVRTQARAVIYTMEDLTDVIKRETGKNNPWIKDLGIDYIQTADGTYIFQPSTESYLSCLISTDISPLLQSMADKLGIPYRVVDSSTHQSFDISTDLNVQTGQLPGTPHVELAEKLKLLAASLEVLTEYITHHGEREGRTEEAQNACIAVARRQVARIKTTNNQENDADILGKLNTAFEIYKVSNGLHHLSAPTLKKVGDDAMLTALRFSVGDKTHANFLMGLFRKAGLPTLSTDAYSSDIGDFLDCEVLLPNPLMEAEYQALASVTQALTLKQYEKSTLAELNQVLTEYKNYHGNDDRRLSFTQAKWTEDPKNKKTTLSFGVLSPVFLGIFLGALKSRHLTPHHTNGEEDFDGISDISVALSLPPTEQELTAVRKFTTAMREALNTTIYNDAQERGNTTELPDAIQNALKSAATRHAERGPLGHICAHHATDKEAQKVYAWIECKNEKERDKFTIQLGRCGLRPIPKTGDNGEIILYVEGRGDIETLRRNGAQIIGPNPGRGAANNAGEGRERGGR